MMKEVGDAVEKDSEVISAVCTGGGTSETVVASVSFRRSLLARWRAFFSDEAAGMVSGAENGWERF